MLNSEAYRNFLINRIPGAKPASGAREVNCRCFYCMDSIDKSHGHFYISIPKSKDEPSKFYCQKCKTKGYVTHKTLLNWGIYDDTIAIDLINHNKEIFKAGNKKYDMRDVYILYNDYIKEDDLSASKLRYINNRLGINLSYQDLLDMKIVLNLNDLINRNNLQFKLTRNYNIVNDLDQSFVGFISLDNAFVNMRRLVQPGRVYSSIDKRYINYDLFKKFDNTERYYTIPTNINLAEPRRIKLNIAEGPFDILSVYYNLRGQSNDIYTAVAGSNYKGIIRHFVSTMKLPYIELHLYLDNDEYGSNAVIQDIADYVKPLECPMYVHRNLYKGQKDFGVDPNHIKEGIDRII